MKNTMTIEETEIYIRGYIHDSTNEFTKDLLARAERELISCMIGIDFDTPDEWMSAHRYLTGVIYDELGKKLMAEF